MPRKSGKKRTGTGKGRRLTIGSLNESLRKSVSTLENKIGTAVESARDLSENFSAKLTRLEQRIMPSLNQTRQELSGLRDAVQEFSRASQRFVEEKTVGRMIGEIRGEFKQNIGILEGSISKLREKLEKTEAQFGETRAGLPNLRGEFENRIALLRSEVDSNVNSRLSVLESIQTSITVLESTMAHLRQEVARVNSDLEQLASRIDQIANALRAREGTGPEVSGSEETE